MQFTVRHSRAQRRRRPSPPPMRRRGASATPGIVPDEFLASIDDEDWAINRRRAIERPRPDMHTFVVLADRTAIIGFAHSGPLPLGRQRPRPGPRRSARSTRSTSHPDHWSTGAGYALMRTAVDHLRLRRPDRDPALDAGGQRARPPLLRAVRLRLRRRDGSRIRSAATPRPKPKRDPPIAVRYTLHP